MRCVIRDCINQTEGVSGFCLEHECRLWSMAHAGPG
jgi:hypothetical protein